MVGMRYMGPCALRNAFFVLACMSVWSVTGFKRIYQPVARVHSPSNKDQMIITLQALPSTQIEKDQVAPV